MCVCGVELGGGYRGAEAPSQLPHPPDRLRLTLDQPIRARLRTAGPEVVAMVTLGLFAWRMMEE